MEGDMGMRYKGVIFDLDGVICSTDELHYLAWKEIADRCQIPFDREMNDPAAGRVPDGEPGAHPVSRQGRVDPGAEAAAGGREERPLPGAAGHLVGRRTSCLASRRPFRRCGPEGWRCDRSSSKNAVVILERLGLSGWFDAVADGTQIKRSKPDPEVFLLAANKLGLPAADCLVVEDAQAGIQAAQAGGHDAASVGPAGGAGHRNIPTGNDL